MWSRAVARLFRHSYGRYGDCGSLPQEGDGLIMRHFIVIGVAAASLAGCSSFSLDAFKSEPPTVQLQLDSVPSGAEARTSTGQSCKTPCSVAVVPPDAGFSVTYTLNKFQPATIPVQVIRVPGDLTTPASTTLDPNPVVAELQPAGPPPKAAGKKILKPKKPKPPKGTAAAPAGSPFPDPGQATAPAAPSR
jgi:hypothetical protein